MILIELQSGPRDFFVSARQMFLNRAHADTEIRGNLLVRFAIQPKSLEDETCTIGQLIERHLEDRKLFSRNQTRFDRPTLLDFRRIARRTSHPILFALAAARAGAAQRQEFIGRHAVKIGLWLIDRPRFLLRKFKRHLLKQVLNFIFGRPTRPQITLQEWSKL